MLKQIGLSLVISVPLEVQTKLDATKLNKIEDKSFCDKHKKMVNQIELDKFYCVKLSNFFR